MTSSVLRHFDCVRMNAKHVQFKITCKSTRHQTGRHYGWIHGIETFTMKQKERYLKCIKQYIDGY